MRVLLIEDSLQLQKSLRTGFTQAGFAIDVVGDGDRGLAFAKREHYDVVILDLMLPGMGGLELLKALREGGSRTQVLILSAKNATEDRVRGLKLGADDYVSKPFSFDELLARVEALVRRRYDTKDPNLVVDDLVIDRAGRVIKKNGQEVTLTKREFSVVEYLAQRCGEVVSRIEIEDHIYTEEKLPESNSIESAMSMLRRKLRDCGGDNPNPIKTHHGIGYCLGGSVD